MSRLFCISERSKIIASPNTSGVGTQSLPLPRYPLSPILGDGASLMTAKSLTRCLQIAGRLPIFEAVSPLGAPPTTNFKVAAAFGGIFRSVFRIKVEIN